METRANHVWVGTVTLALIALLVIFAAWVAHLERGEHVLYDIYFHQSVDGLAKGAGVSYEGVPEGQVTMISLSTVDPGLVKVRVALDPHIAILQGTTATIQGSFTGVSSIKLAGGIKGAPRITVKGSDGVPIIPTKSSGLGALLSSAPVLMVKLATLADRLTDLLSDKNQQQVTDILTNTNQMTRNLADAAPQAKATLANLRDAIAQTTLTLAALQKAADNTSTVFGPGSDSLASQMRATLISSAAAAKALQSEMEAARASTQQLSASTLPQAEATLRDLRSTSQALRNLTEKIDDQGVGSVIAPPKLPEYKP